MGARRKARECALQMLFGYDLNPAGPERSVEDFWRELAESREVIRQFATEIVLGVLEHRSEVDRLIELKADNWRIERMAIVDRNILRLAIYEFLYHPQTPKTVVINEALDIARRFSNYEATQFINGVLDAIRLDLEQNASANTA